MFALVIRSVSACGGDCHGKDCQNTELDEFTYDEEQDEISEFFLALRVFL